MVTLAIALASAMICFTLIVGRSWTLLLNLAVLSGLAQVPLMSIFQSDAFQLVDDVPTAALIVVAVGIAMTSKEKRDHKALGLLALFLVLIAVAAVRSPSDVVAIAQARQVLMPFGLVFAGYVLRDRIDWAWAWKVLLGAGVFAALWVLAEEIIQAPLIDPVWYYVTAVGGSPATLRFGLPPSYFADGVGGQVVFRPGGPFMNPPILGFLLGSAAFAASTYHRGLRRVLLLALLGGALFAAYARGGMLVFVLVVLVYAAWVSLGKFGGVLAGAAVGGYMVTVFLEQGNTASHANGLVSGALEGARSVIGLGFGTTGYQASLEGAAVGAGSESLLGLYMAWLGLPVIVAVIAVIFGLVRRLAWARKDAARPIWLALATVLAAASSESASSISSTTMMWLTLGLVLAVYGRGSHPGEQATTDEARLTSAHGELPASGRELQSWNDRGVLRLRAPGGRAYPNLVGPHLGSSVRPPRT